MAMMAQYVISYLIDIVAPFGVVKLPAFGVRMQWSTSVD